MLIVLGNEKWGIAVTKADVLQSHAQEIYSKIENMNKDDELSK